MQPKDQNTQDEAGTSAMQHSRRRLVYAFVAVRTKLVGTLNRILRNHEDARDATQETFLKCWRGVSRVSRIRDLQAWIFRVGFNAAKDIQRSAWRRKARPLTVVAGREEQKSLAPDVAAEEREDEQRLLEAVRRLRPEEQNVFRLRQAGRLTHEEIAKVLRAPVGTVKTRLRAAISKLRAALHRRSVKRFTNH
jgi:RNA polymerase sigma-70 factor (ECF subfamily)